MIPNRANFLWLQADHPGYFWGQCAEYCGDSHAVMRFRVVALSEKDFNEWLDQQMQIARNVAPPRNANASGATLQHAAPRTSRQHETGISEKFEFDPLEAWRTK